MKNKKHPKRPRKMRREYGIGDFLEHIHGLRKAARKVQHEETLMLKFDPAGKPVN